MKLQTDHQPHKGGQACNFDHDAILHESGHVASSLVIVAVCKHLHGNRGLGLACHQRHAGKMRAQNDACMETLLVWTAASPHLHACVTVNGMQP